MVGSNFGNINGAAERTVKHGAPSERRTEGAGGPFFPACVVPEVQEHGTPAKMRNSPHTILVLGQCGEFLADSPPCSLSLDFQDH